MTEFEKKIRDWLSGEGYPLEMRVAAAFQAMDFDVVQGAYYSDPEETTWRETDVFGGEEKFYSEVIARVSFVVECKKSPSHPWVVFVSNGEQPRPRTDLRFTPTTEFGRPYPVRLSRRAEVLALPLFSGRPVAGHGVVQALGKNDQAYGAVMSVAKAAVAMAAQTDEYSEIDPVMELVFPVVVVDAPLFECRLAPTGDPILTRVQRANLLWRNPAIGRGLTSVDIVSSEILEEFVRGAVESARFILDNSQPEADLAERALKKNRATPPTS